MPFGFPASIELDGRPVVVIGEGAVADHRVRLLLESGATDVRVVVGGAIEVAEADDDRVRVERRAWRPSDLDGTFLCLASSRDARERGAIAAARRSEAKTTSRDDAAEAVAKA